jgi:hypothetical protein
VAPSHVCHTQQADPDPDPQRSCDDASSQKIRIVVLRTVRLVMYVVKLANARDPSLGHLEERQSADRLDRVRIQRRRDSVHTLTPRPKVVMRACAPLNMSTKGTLKSMTVGVH